MPDSAARTAHADGVERLLASYRAIPSNASVRLAKPTSNLFRARAKRDAPGLDTSGLTDVIAVDPDSGAVFVLSAVGDGLQRVVRR